MADVRVRLNSSGMAALLRSDGVRAILRAKAAPILSRAQATAPVDSGDYRASLRMWDDTTDRAVVRVGSSVPYAAVVQANTGHLSRTL